MIYRATATWTGFVGAPGYTSWFADDSGTPANLITGLKGFFDAMTPWLPTDVTVSVPDTYDELDETTGTLIASGTAPIAPGEFVGERTEVYSAPAGACVTWVTDDVVAGRRVRGRTFIVPLSSYATALDGSLGATALTDIRTAASDAITAMGGAFCVWHRPTTAAPASGSAHPITSFNVRDRVAVLRSRRD